MFVAAPGAGQFPFDGAEPMQCPTCGKAFRKGQEVCSFCGALLINSYLADPGRAVTVVPPMPGTGQPPPGPLIPEEWGEPAAEEVEEEKQRFPIPRQPSETSGETRPEGGPKSSSFWRLVTVLVFFLIPLINYYLRDGRLPLGGGEAPAVQELVFCEDIQQGRPVNPKEAFSLQEDARVVAFGTWRGTRGEHNYALRWYTPDGRLFPGSATVTRYQPGAGEFFTYGILPLRPDLPPGKWAVEVVMDSRVQTRSSFELRE